MSLRRIAKTGGALVGGQGVMLLSQLLLPPLFLRNYSISAYGDWLTLSATVVYLATLNFGLQTFANNQAAIHYNRGELEEAKRLQATAMVIILAIVLAAAALATVVFFIPLNRWLGLSTPRAEVSATIYLLGLQVLARIVLTYFGGMFLILGIAHRGTVWINSAALGSLVGTLVAVIMRVSFAWIAATQLAMIVLFALFAIVDFRLKAPDIFPRFRYARLHRMGEIIRPSGYFALLLYSSFFVYQVPVILVQRLLGPGSVVVFSITRTIYGMSRQSLTVFSAAIAPEITELYGRDQRMRLFRLYELSERVIFALVPVVTIGTLLATPLLMAIWLHKPDLYNPSISLLMALISAVMGVKEHKYQFQTASNEHAAIAKLMFFSYVLMVILSIPGIHYFGVLGFLGLWIGTEVIQLLVILRMNQQLFAGVSKLHFSPVYKVLAFMGVATATGAWFAVTARQRSLLQVALVSLAFAVTLAAIGYPLFGLAEVRAYLKTRAAFAGKKQA